MINNKLTSAHVPDTRLVEIIEAVDEVLSALAGTNEDVHPDNSTKMCRLWDDLNDVYAPPEVVRQMARELQESRNADPIYQVATPVGWRDISKGHYHELLEGEHHVRIVYAAPQTLAAQIAEGAAKNDQ